MLKRVCVYCLIEIQKNFLCENCENSLIFCLEYRYRYFVSEETQVKIKHTYFWDFNNTVRKSILNGKYRFNKKVFLALSQIVYDHYYDLLEKMKTMSVCYVPTTYFRYCHRGFNQAKVITENLGFDPIKILKRTKFIKEQKTANLLERGLGEQNFCLVPNSTKLKIKNKILIVDDVCTTGGTLLNCANVIWEKFVDVEIEFLTLAYRKRVFNP